MKLGKLGIFLILLLSLLLAGLGVSTYELMTNRREGMKTQPPPPPPPADTTDDVNNYNDAPNQNNNTYNYVSTTPTSLAIKEDQPPPNIPNTKPTSTGIPVEQYTQPQPQDSSPDDHSSSPQNSNHDDNDSSSGIPQSVDDQYILKSQIVPPVCPKCPDAASCPRPKPCPPCAPCARCPEPAFECKKVPSYQGGPFPTMPKPVLNDFSQFGM